MGSAEDAGLTSDESRVLRDARVGLRVIEEDLTARLIELGLISHSVTPEWTERGRALLKQMAEEDRAAYERGQRARRYVVFSRGRRAVHLNYFVALADFEERAKRVQKVTMHYRIGGGMEAVAWFSRGAVKWANGWPERADEDTRAAKEPR